MAPPSDGVPSRDGGGSPSGCRPRVGASGGDSNPAALCVSPMAVSLGDSMVSDPAPCVGAGSQVRGDGFRLGREWPEPLAITPGDEGREGVAVPLGGPRGAGFARVAGGALQKGPPPLAANPLEWPLLSFQREHYRMSIDTSRLVQIAAELKELDQRRERLLVELQRIAGGGAAPVVHRGPGRPPGSGTKATAHVRRGPGRLPGSRNQAKPVAPTSGRKPRKGLTTDIMGLLADGAAYTAGDIAREASGSRRRRRRSRRSVPRCSGSSRRASRVKKDKERLGTAQKLEPSGYRS